MAVSLNENDFETYKILIPINHLWGRNQNNYVYHQLEKMHPCFSERFCVDKKTKLTKKGFVSDVIVMDRLILGDYKNKYPGEKLKVGNSFCVFSNVKKYRIPVLMSLFFTVLFIIFCVKNLTKDSKKSQSLNQETSKDLSISEDSLNGSKVIEKQNVAFQKLLEEIKKKSGTIKKMSWSFDGVSEKILCTLDKCYPSDFDNELDFEKLVFSPVTFKDGTPEFNISYFNQRKYGILNEDTNENSSARKQFSESIRNLCLSHGYIILEEIYKPYKIRFQLGTSQTLFESDFFSELVKSENESGFLCNEINLDNERSMLVTLGFLENKNDYFTEPPENVVSQNKKCFLEPDNIRNYINSNVKNKTSSNDKTMKTIGFIKHEGEERKTYFINEKGRIKNER